MLKAKNTISVRRNISMFEKEKVVAIDGPAGSGKSTIAKIVAKSLGFVYVDTGAMYRSIGYYLLFEKKITDEKEALPFLKNLEIKYFGKEDNLISLAGVDYTFLIRTPEVAKYASLVSKWKSVRHFLLDFQRQFAEHHFVVMEGRDIGSVIFPHAFAKIYLEASVEVRAKRRFNELKHTQPQMQYEDFLRDLSARDEQDMNRSIAPLIKTPDAVLFDTSSLTLEEVASELIKIVRVKAFECNMNLSEIKG